MRQRWSLGILYLLQMMVLTGVVATYILNNSSHSQPPEAPRLPLKSQAPSGYRDGQVEPATQLKTLSMDYIKDNIRIVNNPIELYRLFTTSNASDSDISHMLELWEKGGKTISPHGVGHKSGYGNDSKKEGHPRFGAQDVSADEMDAGANKTVKNLQNVSLGAADVDSLEYQNDAPATGHSSWSLNTEVLQAAINHLHNYDRDAASVKCKEPTAYLQRVQQPMAVFMPDCIKLYRCMNFTGCCKYPAVCSPKKIQIVKRAFLIFHFRPVYPVSNAYLNAEDVEGSLLTFENHTECECALPDMQQNSCHRTCPAPFVLNVELSQCTCMCPQTNQDVLQECTFIQQGVKQLAEKGLECIKAAECYHPKCERGSFDVPTGLCPLASVYALPSHQFLKPVNHSEYRSHIPGFAQNATGPKITHPYKVLSTTKSPARIQSAKDAAASLARQNSQMSSAYHEGYQHPPLRQKPTPKPGVESKENATAERAEIIPGVGMPNPGMSGSYHENYRPYRPIPIVTDKVKTSTNLSSNFSDQNVTHETDEFFETLSNVTDSYPNSAKNNKSRLGIPGDNFPVNNKSRMGIPGDAFPVKNSGTEIPSDSRNTSIILTAISTPRAQSNVGLYELVTGTQHPKKKSKLELGDVELRNSPRSLLDPQDVSPPSDAAKDPSPAHESATTERPPSPDVPPDQDNGSTDLGQQEGNRDGGGRGAPVDQQEDDVSVFDKDVEGSGQD